MLYVVTALICLSGTPREECTRDTAYDVTVSEKPGCGIDAQATMASTTFRKAGEGAYLKVLCDVPGRK